MSHDGQTKPVDEAAAHSLVSAVSDVPISSILGTKEEPDYDLEHPVLKYTLATNSGSHIAYVFWKPKNQANHVLKISNQNWCAIVDDWQVKRLLELNPSKLFK